jgi:MFS family permease
MTTLVGTAIAATFIGGLSDKLGRRPLMLICVGFGVIGSIAKYFARGSFWAFCAVNFITGLFGATLALALATASGKHRVCGSFLHFLYVSPMSDIL